MSKIISSLLIVVVVSWTGTASATLIDIGNGTVKDTTSGLLWTKQANLGANTSVYDPALATIEALNLSMFAGIDSWRFGSLTELLGMYNQKNEVTQLFNGNLSYRFFTNRLPYGNDTLVEGFNFWDGSSTTLSRYTNDAFTWAVSEETSTTEPISIPATIPLLGIGFAALGYCRRSEN